MPSVRYETGSGINDQFGSWDRTIKFRLRIKFGPRAKHQRADSARQPHRWWWPYKLATICMYTST